MRIFPPIRWFSIAALVFVSTVGCGLCLIGLTPKVYVATAQIQVRPHGVISVPPGGQPDQEYSASGEMEIIQSPDVLEPIIADLDLDKAWAKRVYKPDRDPWSKADAFAYLHGHLKLDYARETNIITISVSDDVPLEAAQIANAIADRYKVMRDVEEDQRINHGMDALRTQIVDRQKAVAGRHAALEVIAETISDPALRSVAQGEIERQQADLDALNVRLRQAASDSKLMESPVRILVRAEDPSHPLQPNVRLDLLVFIVAGLMLGMGVASFVELLIWIRR